MKTDFTIERTFPVSKDKIYEAWLNSEQHSEMTGGEANCSAIESGNFSAWDGYISGKNINLVQNKRIIQNWRTTEFADDEADSTLELTLEDVEGGTKIILHHHHIPEGQSDYEQGWEDHYFTPMKEYFI